MPVPAHAIAVELRRRRPGMDRWTLHKLLYFCQGHHLADLGEPLFGEPIQAWDYGPVVGTVWYDNDRGVPPPELPALGEAELNTIGYVLSRYGALSGRDLINLTHSQDPWQLADAGRQPGTSKRIEQVWITEYFLGDRTDQDGPPLDADEVAAWLRGAEARRDLPGAVDDSATIERRIREFRERAAG